MHKKKAKINSDNLSAIGPGRGLTRPVSETTGAGFHDENTNTAVDTGHYFGDPVGGDHGHLGVGLLSM
jgi:hypothetical protein